MKNISLDKHKLIVFMGSMNAFPMMYALQLKKNGYEVLYMVDAPQSDTLSRPENHYPSINYPYPDWIVEWKLPLQIILLLRPVFFAWILSFILKKKKIGCYVLNGFFISLSPYFSEATIVSLCHGSDLDVWANIDNLDELKKGVFQAKILKLIPSYIQKKIIKNFISKQKKGFCSSDYLVYFPPNFNAAGDKIISEIEKYNVTYLPRFHTSFAPLLGQNREFKENKSTLRIFSGVRFLYEKFPRGNSGYNKGNDKIIKSLAYYYQENKNIKIDFVEKGTDLESAKKLCKKMGLEPAITWHKEMPFDKLTILYQQSDICFDQVGDHWIGAIGYYALWLGKPLIADDKKYIDAGCWPKDNPVCSASSIEEIIYWLRKLSDNDERKKISVLSKLFADKYIELDNHANPIFEV